jgi:hypothetical protein
MDLLSSVGATQVPIPMHPNTGGKHPFDNKLTSPWSHSGLEAPVERHRTSELSMLSIIFATE